MNGGCVGGCWWVCLLVCVEGRMVMVGRNGYERRGG